MTPPDEKDLTNILDLASTTPASESPATAESIVITETQPAETIETFESLEELSKTAPPSENFAPQEPDLGAFPPAEFTPTSPEPALADTPSVPMTTMDKVKEFSEKVMVGTPTVEAALPFNLSITGRLTPEEKEKLLDIINREKMGIEEKDLKLQLDGDRILLPRISEYAGILVIQALRATQAQIKLAPSEAGDALLSADEPQQKSQVSATGQDHTHPAETLPITPQSTVPGMGAFSVIETIFASASLKSAIIEAERSSEYIELLEALQRELKYKAFRKGASAVVNFTVTVTPLSTPRHYRVLAMGAAVKAGIETS